MYILYTLVDIRFVVRLGGRYTICTPLVTNNQKKKKVQRLIIARWEQAEKQYLLLPYITCKSASANNAHNTPHVECSPIILYVRLLPAIVACVYPDHITCIIFNCLEFILLECFVFRKIVLSDYIT